MAPSDKIEAPPPAHLSEASQQLWREIAEENILDAAAFPILLTLCNANDRRQAAWEGMRETGATITDRFGVQKVHPLFAVERDSTAIMHRAFRLLGFDQEARGGSAQQQLFKT